MRGPPFCCGQVDGSSGVFLMPPATTQFPRAFLYLGNVGLAPVPQRRRRIPA